MKKTQLVALFLMILTLISGCIEKKPVKYYYETNTELSCYLYPDGAFIAVQKESFSGSYRVEGDNIFLVIAPFGTTFQLVPIIKINNSLCCG